MHYQEVHVVCKAMFTTCGMLPLEAQTTTNPPCLCAHARFVVGVRRLQVMIADAGHACYVDRPEDFHNALLPFLKGIDPHFRVVDKYAQQNAEL
jgi:hypothetical protein